MMVLICRRVTDIDATEAPHRTHAQLGARGGFLSIAEACLRTSSLDQRCDTVVRLVGVRKSSSGSTQRQSQSTGLSLSAPSARCRVRSGDGPLWGERGGHSDHQAEDVVPRVQRWRAYVVVDEVGVIDTEEAA